MERVTAPIDNKNLMEDAFEDGVFRDFYAAYDHRDRGERHLIGHKAVRDEEFGTVCEQGIMNVRWKFGDNAVRITLLAVPGGEDWESVRESIFKEYREEFKSWECEDNPDLVVEFYELRDTLTVIFYFECE